MDLYENTFIKYVRGEEKKVIPQGMEGKRVNKEHDKYRYKF